MTSHYYTQYIIAIWSEHNCKLQQVSIWYDSSWKAVKDALILCGLEGYYREQINQASDLKEFRSLIEDESIQIQVTEIL